MNICMAGIDHNHATIDVRELFAFTQKNKLTFLAQLNKMDGIQGCIILSTCNRMELWASVKDDFKGSLYEILCQVKEIAPKQYRGYFCELRGKEAVNHLFHLACGLKSQIMGEDQIVTQVGEALSFARENQFSDSILEVLFRKAVTAGKKVKTEVIFPKGNESSINQAIHKLKSQRLVIRNKNCMVIGNGQMGKIAAQAFVEAGANVFVTIRQYRHGCVEIPKDCMGISYSDREEYLPICDYIVSATTSPHQTVTKCMLEKYQPGRSQILIDLAVPRDIDMQVVQIEGITLMNIDDFKTSEQDAAMKIAVDKAEKILKVQIEEFYQWLGGHKVMPRIQYIKEEAVNDLNLRIEKSLKSCSLEDAEKLNLIQTISKAADKVVNKMIFSLRDDLREEEFISCIDSWEQLYEES
ncbi:glutamyl-tRNA reductase [Anaerosacchariphilus polymeriproducens]|uniref:Glutamyl-tRNA reductase n=1 Tax=Anaerosacchariphilus polymeriproducens TaxID=1812858 RepID=A0A371AY81_9FIRM|nr:glutamyl-tRNA reductase [Anaerosacchariphilus polymeriproducens]RDU24548.1 glutamyl-tRNA reductase [Anaerosacchariphilus polymeriproducens]